MEGKMQPNKVYAHVESEIGSQEVDVEEILDGPLDDGSYNSRTCYYFVHVDEEDNDTRGTPHEEDEVGACVEDGCPNPQSMERASWPNFSYCN